MTYEIPEEYYFRLHHPRPRFKGDLENVLFFIAKEIANIDACPNNEFKARLNKAIRRFPGNLDAKEKTINNWRTEISSLFGLIDMPSSPKGYRKASSVCMDLSDNENLIAFFRRFLLRFQYPGGHQKPNKIVSQIENGVKFKPAHYLLDLLVQAHENDERIGISKEEATFCVFSDLRVTRDGRPASETLALIKSNRDRGVSYESGGDLTRYAMDILDYLVLADFLERKPDSKYYIRIKSLLSIKKFIEARSFFLGYEPLYGTEHIEASQVSCLAADWISYVNETVDEAILSVNVADLLSESSVTATSSGDDFELFISHIGSGELKTKEIGDMGENIILSHERKTLKALDRSDLIHLVKHIPTPLAAGYDVSSRSADGAQKCIEVKTTISRNSLTVGRFHLTPNEWNIAQDLKDTYFVYRVLLSKDGVKLFVINNPVQKYKEDKIKMYIRDGAEITYNDSCGNWEDVRL